MEESKNETTTAQPTELVIKIGYDGEKRPVKFTGLLVLEDSNHSHQGPNQNRWHEWKLYKVQEAALNLVPVPDQLRIEIADVQPALYRVLDRYRTCWQGESGHVSLSKAMTAKEIVKKYPHLGAAAIEDGTFDEDEVAESLGLDEEAPTDQKQE